MKRLCLFSLCFIFLFVACKTKDGDVTDKPNIDEKTMLNIMSDIAKAERLSFENKITDKTKEPHSQRTSVMQEYKRSILKHYGVSAQEYERNFQIYLNSPTRMRKLLNSVKSIR